MTAIPITTTARPTSSRFGPQPHLRTRAHRIWLSRWGIEVFHPPDVRLLFTEASENLFSVRAEAGAVIIDNVVGQGRHRRHVIRSGDRNPDNFSAGFPRTHSDRVHVFTVNTSYVQWKIGVQFPRACAGVCQTLARPEPIARSKDLLQKRLDYAELEKARYHAVARGASCRLLSLSIDQQRARASANARGRSVVEHSHSTLQGQGALFTVCGTLRKTSPYRGRPYSGGFEWAAFVLVQGQTAKATTDRGVHGYGIYRPMGATHPEAVPPRGEILRDLCATSLEPSR
jgi:hypothetical protein